MEPQIIKPGSPRNQESPPDSSQPIDAKTQLTIPWVSTEEETSSSAARPDSLELDRFGDFESEPMIYTGDFHFGNADAAPSLMLPSPETPLYDAFLDKVASTGDEDVMEYLAEFGVFDKLRFKKPYGSAEPPADKRDDPYQLGLRTEYLLAVTNKQRSNHIARLASRNDVRAQTPHALVFTSDDMKETMNQWRKQPETWSNTLQTVNDMGTTQEYHLCVKSRFNTMLFQLFGNKSLVEMFVRFPICSAEQPAPLLRRFAQACQSLRSSPEANRARENSGHNMPGEVGLSKQIYALKNAR